MTAVGVGLLLVGAASLTGCGKDAQAKTYGQRKADGREMVKSTRERWDWKSWNQLLDENVVLSVNFGAVGAVGAEVVAETDELPFMAYLRFNEAWKIEQMTLATVDLRPLNAALEENR